MKNKKNILSALIISAIILPISASAMYCADQPDWICEWVWNWEIKIMKANLETPEVKNFQNKWNWKGNWNWKWNGYWMWKWNWQGQWKMNNSEKTESKDFQIELPPMQDLSDYEAERLSYQYSEEMVARDAYNHMYSLYWTQTFKNIADAEQKHMNAVKKLLDRYSLEIPTWYWVLQDEFDNLKAEWEKWLKEALEVWVKIEILDIDDISETMRNVDNNDILAVYSNIWWGSYNHMRWFVKALRNNWFKTNIDYSAYLNEEEANSKWWALKVKLAEKLESEWVILPETASSKAISEKMENSNWKAWEKKWNWKNKGNKNWESEEKWFFWKILSVLLFWR